MRPADSSITNFSTAGETCASFIAMTSSPLMSNGASVFFTNAMISSSATPAFVILMTSSTTSTVRLTANAGAAASRKPSVNMNRFTGISSQFLSSADATATPADRLAFARGTRGPTPPILTDRGHFVLENDQACHHGEVSDFAARMYRLIFSAAAAYNIAFGLWASLVPREFFRVFRLDVPRYPGIFACLGMVVGLYGVGYAYAAWRLDRAFPFITIGLAGKILGPIGWVMSVGSGELPARTFPLIVFDDLMWWLPFAMFLLEATAVTRFLKRNAPYWSAGLH